MRKREIYGIRVPEIVYEFVPETKKNYALDLGCNSGIVTEFLGELGYLTTGIDIFLPDECQNHDNINYILKDLRNFKFIKEKYKMVVALDILQFLKDSEKYRILKKIIYSLSIEGIFIMRSITTKAPSMKINFKNSPLVEENSFKNKNGIISYFELDRLKFFLKEFQLEFILFREDIKMGVIELVCQKR